MKIQRGGKDRPLYMISVAAELAGMHPQTLRIYERKRLVQPQRSAGNTRLYSDADIERLEVLLQAAQTEATSTERRIAEEIQAVRASLRADIVHVPRGGIVRRGTYE